MDKRLTVLLSVAYVVFGAIALATLEFDDYLVKGAYVLIEFVVPAIVLLGVVWIILAVRDSVSQPKAVDGRYFTRCFFYRIASGVFVLLFCVIPYKQVMDFPIICPPWCTPPSIGERLQFWSYLPGCVVALILIAAVNVYVILGIASTREKKIVSRFGTGVHILLLFILGLDLISALYLMINELKICPNERIRWAKHVFGR